MSRRNKKWREEEEGGNNLFTPEEEKLATEIEETPIEDLPYEIIPTQGGGPASLQQDSLFKLIVIGDSGIGKSCLMHRMCHNEFTDDHEVTVGVEFGSILVKIKDNNQADIRGERLENTIPANGRSIRMQVEKIKTK